MKILPRLKGRLTPLALEEQDSRYESGSSLINSELVTITSDDLAVKTIGRNTHEWDVRDCIRRMKQELHALEETLPFPKPSPGNPVNTPDE